MVGANPKKELGQHWLYDSDVLEAMCDAIELKPGDEVLEIGPGLGTLTARLLDRHCIVWALEFDAVLARDLIKNVYRQQKENDLLDHIDSLTVVEGDIRTFNFSTMPVKYKLCANIPYYLTSNLIRLLCDTPNQPVSVAILVQKEVAQRVVAKSGKMSILSCVAQFYYECTLGEIVPAKLFTPPPKVDSQILIMKRREKPMFDVDTKQFFKLIKAGFGEKRKTLRNSLSGGLVLGKDVVVALLVKSSVDPMARAETLSLEDWQRIYSTYAKSL